MLWRWIRWNTLDQLKGGAPVQGPCRGSLTHRKVRWTYRVRCRFSHTGEAADLIDQSSSSGFGGIGSVPIQFHAERLSTHALTFQTWSVRKNVTRKKGITRISSTSVITEDRQMLPAVPMSCTRVLYVCTQQPLSLHQNERYLDSNQMSQLSNQYKQNQQRTNPDTYSQPNRHSTRPPFRSQLTSLSQIWQMWWSRETVQATRRH